MKTRLPHELTCLLIITLLMSACAPPAVPSIATQTPPAQPPASPTPNPNIDVMLQMVERLNAGDVEGSLVYFADDAMVYLMGFPPTGIEIYAGKDQIRQLWQDSVDNHFRWEVNVNSARGDIINVAAQTWHDFTQQLGVAPLAYEDVYEFKNGKIITYGSWLTEPSLAKFRPAFAEVVPPEPTATPSDDPPVSEFTVTFAAGTCTTTSPLLLKAGEVKVNVDMQDQANEDYAVTLFNLDAGKDILDLMVATFGYQPGWADLLLMETISPGESASYSFTVENGPVYLVCWSKPPDLPIGNVGPIPVVP
jgi:ketosteroid isomerase-like protein